MSKITQNFEEQQLFPKMFISGQNLKCLFLGNLELWK